MARLFQLEHAPTTDDWYTPPWVFGGLGLTFDLDVAAPPGGVPWIPARRALSEDDDGLLVPWEGLVWCNPPYSAPIRWCTKWATHSDGIILLRADLSTSGPFVAFSAAHGMWVPRKRLQFVNGHSEGTGAVSFSTVLLSRGDQACAGLERLAGEVGGAFRTLS